MGALLSGPSRRRGLPGLDRRLLRARASKLLRALERPDDELSIRLLDDREIAELNAAWRGVEGPTDVLAFSQLEGEGAEYRGGLLGDVAISVETAARQARRARRALDDEVARLLIHGTLHLLGYDHARAAQAREMRAAEQRLWRAIRQ